MVGRGPHNVVYSDLAHFMIFKRGDSELPDFVNFCSTQVDLLWQFTQDVVGSPGWEFYTLWHCVSILLQVPQTHPQINILLVNGLVFFIIIPKVEISSNYDPGAVLGEILDLQNLLLPDLLVPIQTLIMHTADDNIPAFWLQEFGEDHAPAHEAVLEGNLVEQALILGEDQSIVPAHRNNASVVTLNPAIFGERVQQINEILGDFLQANEVAVAELQDPQNALVPNVFVVRLKPDVVCQHRNSFGQDICLKFGGLQLFPPSELIDRVLMLILYLLTHMGFHRHLFGLYC